MSPYDDKSENDGDILFERAPHAMFVIGRDFNVLRINETASLLSDFIREKTIGLKPGAILKCINAMGKLKGCGDTEECRSCLVNLAIIKTFQQEKDQSAQEATLIIERDNHKEYLTIKCSTSFIKSAGEDRIILSLENANITLNPEKIIPICSQCRKVRNEYGLWKNIEVYFERLYHMGFSHSLCPECAEALYGHKKWFKKD